MSLTKPSGAVFVTDTTKSDTTHNHTFTTLLSKPTTIAGYGITDASLSNHNHTLDGLSNITITTKASGNYLKWNGTAWVNTMISVSDIPTLNQNTTGSAATLTTPRTISLTGDTTGTVSFNGSVDAPITTTLSNTGVAAGTYKSVTVDVKGRISAGTNPTTLAGYGITDSINVSQKGIANGVATLGADAKIPATQLPSFVDDVLEYANLAGFPVTGETGKIYVAIDTNKTYRWSGTVYVYITSGAVDSVAGKTGVVTLVKADVGLGLVDNIADASKNVLSATKLTTARSITLAGDTTGTVSFDGTANVSITSTLSNTGVTAGTYKSVTVDAKGRISAGTNPTTLSGYGITDASLSNHNHTLDGLSNITITTKATGNFLKWNGTAWVNTMIGVSDIPTLNQNTTGSAATLTTPRTINGVSFNGSANITITDDTKLPISGGTMTGTLDVSAGLSQDGNTILNGTDTWLRTTAATGWYSTTYAGGIHMTDTTWVRIFNAKAFYVANDIAATGNVTAYYSDMRLKTKIGNIENPLDKLMTLNGFYYVNNDLAKSVGYTSDKVQVALSAQEVNEVMPEVISLAPFDMDTDEITGEIKSKSGENYMTVDYSKLVPLLIESIKEQQKQIAELKKEINNIKKGI